MPFKLLLAVLGTLVAAQAWPLQYLSIKEVRVKSKHYEYPATVLDTDQANQPLTKNLITSRKRNGLFMLTEDRTLLLAYVGSSNSDEPVTAKVYDSKNLSLVSELKLWQPYITQRQTVWQSYLFQLTRDSRHLLIANHFDKQAHVQKFNLLTGEKVFDVVLEKKELHKFLLSQDHTRALSFDPVETRAQIWLHDLDSGQVLQKINHPKGLPDVTMTRDFFLIQGKTRGPEGNKRHSGWIHRLSDGQMLGEIHSSQPLALTQAEPDGDLFVLYGDALSSGHTVLERVHRGGERTRLAQFEVDMKPLYFDVDTGHMRAMAMGKDQVITVDLNDPNTRSVTESPFDADFGLINPAGDKLFIRERSGSEVALIDLSNGQLIKRSGTGRAGVKFGQGLLAGLGILTGAATGYYFIPISLSNTAMITDLGGRHLYVVNSKTSDITTFDADTLENRHSTPIGGGAAMAVFHLNEDDPVFAISRDRFTQFDPRSAQSIRQLETRKVLLLDPENNTLIHLDDDETLKVISTRDEKTLRRFENLPSDWVFNINTPPETSND